MSSSAPFRTAETQDRSVSSVAVDESGKLVSIVSNRGIELCNFDSLFLSETPQKELQVVPVITVKPNAANASLVTSMNVVWNPSRSMGSLFATTTPNSRVLLWKVGGQAQQSPAVVSQIVTSRTPSKTTIASLSWSLPEPTNFVTCAGRNSDVIVWSMDSLSCAKVVMNKPISASVVSCNKINRNIFASGHDNGEIRIWDIKANKDINFIMAHRSRLLSIGWSPINENILMTSSIEKDAKVWDLRKPLTPLFTISYDQLPTKALFTPSGNGVIVSYQNLSVVNVWAFSNLSKPLYQLKGPSNSHVLNFAWRKCESGKDEYDVITSNKNKTLGLWKIPQHVHAKLMEPCDVYSVKVTKTQATSTTQQDELDSEFEQVYESPKLRKFLKSADRTQRVCVLLWEGKPKGSQKASEKSQAQEDVDQDALGTETYGGQPFNDSLYQVKIKVSFPSMYPKAIASFEVIRQITPNDAQESNAILGNLKQKAHECAIEGKGCLMAVIEELDTVCSKLVETVKAPIQAPTQPMPCPRFSGCCFSPSGEFVYFVQSRNTRMEKCPRTYQEFLDQIKNSQNLPQSKFSIKSKNVDGANTGGSGNPKTSSGGSTGDLGRRNSVSTGNKSTGAVVDLSYDPDGSEGSEGDSNRMTYYKTAALYYSQQQMFQFDTVQEGSMRNSLPDFASTVTQVNEKRAETNPVHYVSSVWRTCFDFIMPFSPDLARQYVLSGPSVKEICRVNEGVARRLGRKDLSSMWNILSMLLDSEADKSRRSMLNFDWMRRPIGMKMVEEIFKKAICNRDMQTLGILSCIMILYDKETNMQTISGKGSKCGTELHYDPESASSSTRTSPPISIMTTPTTTPFFGAASHESNHSMSPVSLKGSTPSGRTSYSPMSSSPVEGARLPYQGSSHIRGGSRSGASTANSGMGNGFPHGTFSRKLSVTLMNENPGSNGASLSGSLLSSSKGQSECKFIKPLFSDIPNSSGPLQQSLPHIYLEEYPYFMHSYATLLYKWGLFYEMKTIHDFIDMYNEMYPPLGSFSPRQCPQKKLLSPKTTSLVKEVGQCAVSIKDEPTCFCFNCKAPSPSYACPKCSRIILKCSLCHLSVKGLSWFCTSCLHGGHLGHMAKWFKENDVCPTGCGCKCKENAYRQNVPEEKFSPEKVPFEDVPPELFFSFPIRKSSVSSLTSSSSPTTTTENPHNGKAQQSVKPPKVVDPIQLSEEIKDMYENIL